MLSRPIFAPLEFAQAPVTLVWTSEVSDSIRFPTEHEYPRLMQAMDHLNLRGQFLALTSIAEWIYWRLVPHAASSALDDLNQRLESAYAALASAAYANLVGGQAPANLPEHIPDAVRGPAMMASRLLTEGFERYCDLDARVGFCAARTAVLAQRVAAQEHVARVEAWLEALLRRIAARFADDSTELAVVPRIGRYYLLDSEPFDEGRNQRAIDEFVRGLDPDANPYLNTPAEMQALGFPGTPYRFAG